ncbi:MAG: mannitol-1-phosphate 5-dehydrogenase [Spirochaetales bacterium]|nr:mannitol-1-phosphate 5-dehydrogenase [Spirochaetales bacterium]
MKKSIQFGAGNIGRGFIGNLISKAGYFVTFADISQVLIPLLKEEGKYTVEVVGDEKQEIVVDPVSGLLSDDPALLDEIAGAQIITTAVGPNVLKIIAPTIAAGIVKRMESGVETPLNIIACENMVRGSSALRDYVFEFLDDDAKAFAEEHVGFPDSAVDRIVPPAEGSDDPLRVRVEEFSEWIVDKTQFAGEIPEIPGMELTDNLMAFVERKLFTLNTGHAISAYLGYQKGYGTIGESIADPEILEEVKGAMAESGEVLIRRYGFDREKHAAYIEKIINRFKNPWLKDYVGRVGRQPLRKLGFNDRFIKPLRGTIEYSIGHANLVAGIVAALKFDDSEDPQVLEMKGMLNSSDLKNAIRAITSLEEESVLDEIASSF